MSSNVPNNKKESTASNIAANFFERIDKLRKQTNSAIPAPTVNPVLNFGLSFHKKLNEEQNSVNADNNENSGDDCVVSVTSLNSHEASHDHLSTSPSKIQDDLESESKKIADIQDKSANESLTVSKISLVDQSELPPTPPIRTSISASKISNVIEELLNSSESSDSTVNSVKKKLLTKKKSLELSFENIKILKNLTNAIPPTAIPAVQPKQTNERLISSISENSSLASNNESIDNLSEKTCSSSIKNNDNGSLSSSSMKEFIEANINDGNSDSISTKSSIAKKEENDIDINQLFPDNENEFSEHNGSKKSDAEFKIYNYKYKIILLSVVIYYFSNISPFLSGLVFGAVFATIMCYLFFKLNHKQKTQAINVDSIEHEKQYQHKFFQVEKSDKNFSGVYKGWMNELREKYNPSTYFLNKTRSVYASLDGNILRLQTTNTPIPKRAVFNETMPIPKFMEHKIYDLKDCNISILPDTLVRKRYWSKKYPVYLQKVKLLSKSSTAESNSQLSSKLNDSVASVEPKINEEGKLQDDELVLFARCDREKEEWFNLFKKASKNQLPNSKDFMKPCLAVAQPVSTTTNITPVTSVPATTNTTASNNSTKKSESSNLLFSYDATKDSVSLQNVNENNNKSANEAIVLNYEKTLKFLNLFLLRTFADFFTHQQWIEKIKNKIQGKINTIRLPYFIEEIIITDIDLGVTIPLIKNTNEPYHDEKGLWAHLDIDYNGGFKMSLATKVNLMSLKKYRSAHTNSSGGGDSSEGVEKKPRERHLGMKDSDQEDSPESSGDECTFVDDEKIETPNTSKKLMNIVNKITASSYFQKATDYKYVKMAMENVSNKQILLTVEVKRVNGTLALNIPPHPSDRLWYGFVGNPTLTLIATPQFGEKEFSYAYVTDWIADKLKQEFQKVLVHPNFDDIYIPLLKSEVNY